MPFEIVETETKKNMPPTALISYMRPKPRKPKMGTSTPKKPYNREDVHPCLIVSIPTTVCGTSKAEKFELLLGTGNDRGKLRIKGSKAAKAIEPAQLMHSFIWRFGYVPRLGETIFDGERCPVRKINENEFEIDIRPALFDGDK